MTNKSHDADVDFIRALAEMLNENDLGELQVQRDYGDEGKLKVRVSKYSAPPAAAPAPPPPAAAPATHANDDSQERETVKGRLGRHPNLQDWIEEMDVIMFNEALKLKKWDGGFSYKRYRKASRDRT